MLQQARKAAYSAASAALRSYYRSLGMEIGEGVKLSRKTHLDQTNPRGVRIGDWTALGPGARVLTHDFTNRRHLTTTVGRNSFIGAHAILMPGVSVGDNCIVSAGAVVYTDIPAGSLVVGNPGRVNKSGLVTGRWGIQEASFLAEEGVSMPERRVNGHAVQTADPGALLASYLPQVSDPSIPFEDLDIDSFALITLRAEIEETEGSIISDEAWTEIERPSDLLRFITRPKAHRSGQVVGATAARSYEINMPQMALGGLSESWVFKEAGDLHWSLLTSALGVRSRDIADQTGERLYATFTRIRHRSTVPLARFRENDRLDTLAAMTRFGAGMFFSSQQWKSAEGSLEFEVASSFSKFGESGKNTSLMKGQPAIPEGFAVPSLPELPEFTAEYRKLRAEEPSETLFETEYEILPQHDINGVGLLYFAAYPTISDICLMRHLGSALKWSPVARDICYFANAGASDRLTYRLHEEAESDGLRYCVGSLYRNSDGKRMARIAVTFAPQ